MNPKTRRKNQPQYSLTLMLDFRAQAEILEERIVQQALSGSVWVLDAGNCFNPLRLTRRIRRQTIQIRTVLDHIQVARAFTCFQVVSLLEQTQAPQGPVYILRLLATFRDEMIPVYERLRLLEKIDRQIGRLQQTAPVVVALRGSALQEDPLLGWVAQLQTRADEVIFPKLVEPHRLAVLF